MTGPYLWMIVSALLILPGCAPQQEISRTPRTAVEQLLLGQALERAVGKLSLPIPAGASLLVEASGLQTDRAHLQLMNQEHGVVDNLHGICLSCATSLRFPPIVWTGFLR